MPTIVKKLALMGLFVALAPLGCHIEHYEGCDKDDKKGAESGPSDEAKQVCSGLCGRLITCGTFPEQNLEVCMAGCEDAFERDAAATTAGCKCVEVAACMPLDGYHCPGAPLPGGSGQGGSSQGAGGSGSGSTTGGSSQGGSGQSTGGSSQGGSSGGSGSATCQTNHDCANSEDCVSGVCLPRCHASCECRTGESCVEGYCRKDAPPPVSCQSDCECPSGQQCVAGSCG